MAYREGEQGAEPFVPETRTSPSGSTHLLTPCCTARARISNSFSSRRADLLSLLLCSIERVKKGVSRVLVGANCSGNPHLALRVHTCLTPSCTTVGANLAQLFVAARRPTILAAVLRREGEKGGEPCAGRRKLFRKRAPCAPGSRVDLTCCSTSSSVTLEYFIQRARKPTLPAAAV